MKKNLNNKKNKTATDNQWTSIPVEYHKSKLSDRKPKTATDNQWTSTSKDNPTQ